MTHNSTRRDFLRTAATASAGVAMAGLSTGRLFASEHDKAKKKPLFKLSLAEWSLHRTLFAGKLDNLDFAKTAKNDYGIKAVEYVNQFFKDKAKDEKYLAGLGIRHTLAGASPLGFLAR